MNVLGVHVGHDSAAAIVQDARVVADAAEERFNRTKHSSALPVRAIDYCLRRAGLEMSEIDRIAVASAGPVLPLNQLFALDSHRAERPWLQSQRGAELRLSLPTYYPVFPVGSSARIVHVSHHLAHAAAAHHTSGCSEPTLVASVDGMGDGVSAAIWHGLGARLSPLKKFGANGSLGWAYGAVTEALGWWVGDGEGKTMALAPYGDGERAMPDVEDRFPRYVDGDLSRPHDFGRTQYWNEAGALHWHFRDAAELVRSLDGATREDVAAAAQDLLERNVIELVRGWLRRTGARRLCCAGGVFLNVKMNARLREELDIESMHVFPNAGDAGLALGAALEVASREEPPSGQALRSLSLGPDYDADAIRVELERRKVPHCRPPDIAGRVAELLARGDVVAWFQGGMESGPRALGGRSILMDPRRPENKDILNRRVKRRESFRPFCPSILAERACDYLERYVDERFMINAFQVRAGLRDRIPAVVHVDGSTRPQAVHRATHPLFWSLISEFERRTSVPVVLNTSLNLATEPIACGPADALRCFWDSGIDHLAIGPFLLSKRPTDVETA